MLAIELALLFVYIAAGDREKGRIYLLRKVKKLQRGIDSRQTKYSDTKSIPNTARTIFSGTFKCLISPCDIQYNEIKHFRVQQSLMS